MKRLSKWCREHFYEIWIFLAGMYFENAIWYWDKGDWESVMFYIFMGALFLVSAKMEK
jgi:hypothetical protein